MKASLIHTALCLNVIFFIQTITATNSYYTQIVKDSACNGQNGTCSPNWCSRVSNAACVDPLNGNVIDPTNGPVFACKVCTPAPISKCSASFLNSVIIKSGGFLAAYCNNEFLVIISTGKASHTNWLSLIPHPPASGYGPYEQACVTRTYHQQVAMFKVPLYPELLSTADPSNNLAYFSGQDDPAAIPLMGLPESGAASVSVSGLSIFPLYNNVKQVAMANCEVDKCNAHAGQGFDYHYHGDPFHPDQGTCMYSPSDYASSTAHPPMIGWALDGFYVFGRHIKTTNLGYSEALDRCGGHSHTLADGVTAMEYHYHTQVINMTAPNGKTYQTYSPGVLDCYRGNLTLNRGYFENSVPTDQRADVDMLRPCCGQTEYVVDKGFVINGMISKAPTKAPSRSPTAQPGTASPTAQPGTASPTAHPSTASPSVQPSLNPSVTPTTASPTLDPTSAAPSVSPTTAQPTTTAPSVTPTLAPSNVPTVSPSLTPTVVPTTTTPSVSPTLTPSNVPTVVPSQRPTTVSPTTALPTTHRPTLLPTQAPSYQSEPVVTFSAAISLAGLSSSSLDSLSADAVVNATARSMGISEDFVTFSGSTFVQTSRRLTGGKVGLLVTYTVTATTAVVIPLINYAADTDATALYESLKTKLTAATSGSSSTFVDYLAAASAANGAMQTFGVTSASSSVTPVSIVAAPSFAPTSGPDSEASGLAVGAIVGIAVGGACVLILALVGLFFLFCRGASATVQTVTPSISPKDHSAATAVEAGHAVAVTENNQVKV